MIHPSTMAGPNWLTGSFGTTPFQQSMSPLFRNNPFLGSTFGPGTNPFQTFGFGPQTAQFQNTINEITRQVVPTILASYGVPQNTFGFQTPFGVPGQFGLQGTFGYPQSFGFTPFGTPFQGGFTDIQSTLQNPAIVAELARQSTNLALQTLGQQFPGQGFQSLYGQPFTGVGTLTGFGTPFTSLGMAGFGTPGLNATPQNLLNAITQCCQSAANCVASSVAQFCQTQGIPFNPNIVAQVCQTVASNVAQCLTQMTQGQNTPLNLNLNSTPQFGVSSGIPTGAGAF